MSLGKKITALVLLLGGCIGVGCYAAISWSVFPEFQEFERGAARDSLDRLDRVIDAELRAFSIVNSEYAEWNATYDFVLGRYEGYVEENLDFDYWRTFGIDLVLMYDVAGSLVWGTFTDASDGSVESFGAQLDPPIDRNHPLLQHGASHDQVIGALQTGRGPMLIASGPILSNHGDGPKAGSFVIARYIDDSLVADVADRSSVVAEYFDITPAGAGRLDPEQVATLAARDDGRLVEDTDTEIVAHRLVRDVFGEPAGIVQIRMPRTITDIGREAINTAMSIIAAVTSIFVVAMVWLFRGLVVTPVNRLAGKMRLIRDTGDLESNTMLTQSDEIGALAREFDELTTDLHLAQKELEATRDVAVEASRAKSDFLARMSHEIRTPMNGVLGMTELLKNTRLDYEQRRFADSIYNSAESLLEIINDILDFSKIEAGKLQLDVRDIDLGAVVEETVDTVAPQAQKKGLEMLIDVDTAAHTSLRGDSVRLRQVLTNLISNAIKFTNRGEVVVRATVSEQDADSATLRFEVADTGIGIQPDKQKIIFDSFAQEDSSTTRLYGGTGLGLAISKQLVDLMGGDLELESTPGVGSKFSFTLRMARGESAGEISVMSGARVAGARVLVVDDNATNREILEQQLRGWRAFCDCADSAEAATERLEASLAHGETYDLVVLDMHMPRVDGIELARRIRAEHAFDDVKLLLLSSVAMPAAEETLRELGIAGQITKPVRQSQLYDCLSVVLTGHALAPHYGAQGTGSLHALAGRVLLAEDNGVNQAVATGMLQSVGVEVEVVADGRAAVDAVAADDYDLVLMDCQMPVMDGLTATQEIRRAEAAAGGRRLPIVALTANAMAGDREQCLEAGMDEYLGKPFTKEQLHAVLSLYLAASGSEAAEPGEPAPPAVDRGVLAVLKELQQPGSPSLVEKVIGIYLESAPELKERVVAAIAEDDAATLCESAHALKSSSTNVGATRLAELCKRLERMARDGDLSGASTVGGELEDEYGRAIDALRAELEEVAQ